MAAVDARAVAHRDVLGDQGNVAALAVAACQASDVKRVLEPAMVMFRSRRDRDITAGSAAGCAAVDLPAAVEQETFESIVMSPALPGLGAMAPRPATA